MHHEIRTCKTGDCQSRAAVFGYCTSCYSRRRNLVKQGKLAQIAEPEIPQRQPWQYEGREQELIEQAEQQNDAAEEKNHVRRFHE